MTWDSALLSHLAPVLAALSPTTLQSLWHLLFHRRAAARLATKGGVTLHLYTLLVRAGMFMTPLDVAFLSALGVILH